MSGPAAVHVTFAEASLRHQEARPVGKVKRLRDSPRAAFPDLSILFPQLRWHLGSSSASLFIGNEFTPVTTRADGYFGQLVSTSSAVERTGNKEDSGDGCNRIKVR